LREESASNGGPQQQSFRLLTLATKANTPLKISFGLVNRLSGVNPFFRQHKARGNSWSRLEKILEPIKWATGALGQARPEGEELRFYIIDWLREPSIAHIRGLGYLPGIGPGVPALRNSASAAWLYAIAHIRELRMKEPPGSAQPYCWRVLLNGISKTQQSCRDTYTEAKSAQGKIALADAHYAPAFLRSDAWEWADVECEYRRAIKLIPNLARAHIAPTVHLSDTGPHEQAIEESERGREFDPLSPDINRRFARTLCYAPKGQTHDCGPGSCRAVQAAAGCGGWGIQSLNGIF
jgi:hypothetical protein